MNSVTFPTLAALLLQIALGLAVYQANRRRLANQCFLLLSVTIAGWLGSLCFAFVAATPDAAAFGIRQASATTVFYLATLNLLRLSVRQKLRNWRDLLGTSRIWLLATIVVVGLCQTPFFLKGALISETAGLPPRPIYGEGVYVYSAYFVVAFVVLMVSYWRDLRKTSGGEHAELSFILIGGIAAIGFAVGYRFCSGLLDRSIARPALCAFSGGGF